MTLAIGTGPFGDQGEKAFNFGVRAPNDHVLYFEDSPRRVRVLFGGETVEDLVRCYPEPIAAAEGIRGRLCFFNERVDLEVDGEPQERPKTQWS